MDRRIVAVVEEDIPYVHEFKPDELEYINKYLDICSRIHCSVCICIADRKNYYLCVPASDDVCIHADIGCETDDDRGQHGGYRKYNIGCCKLYVSRR